MENQINGLHKILYVDLPSADPGCHDKLRVQADEIKKDLQVSLDAANQPGAPKDALKNVWRAQTLVVITDAALIAHVRNLRYCKNTLQC